MRSEIRCVGDWRVIGQVTLKTLHQLEQPPYISRMLGSTGGSRGSEMKELEIALQFYFRIGLDIYEGPGQKLSPYF